MTVQIRKLDSTAPDFKQQLTRLLAQHDVPLIEDDTYGALTDDDTPLAAAKSWDATGNVITLADLYDFRFTPTGGVMARGPTPARRRPLTARRARGRARGSAGRACARGRRA